MLLVLETTPCEVEIRYIYVPVVSLVEVHFVDNKATMNNNFAERGNGIVTSLYQVLSLIYIHIFLEFQQSYASNIGPIATESQILRNSSLWSIWLFGLSKNKIRRAECKQTWR